MNPKLRSSVSTIVLNENIIEFFLSNTRKQVRIKLPNSKLVDLILALDGTKSVVEISMEYQLDSDAVNSLINLLTFLQQKSVITDSNMVHINESLSKYRRVIHFLEDFAESREDLHYMWGNIHSSHVLIIGLGAVGTWIAITLAQSGVKHFTLIDNDVVELSNLHRQLSYFEDDIGKNKLDVCERNLQILDPDIIVNKVHSTLKEGMLSEYLTDVDLVINCADKPTVDMTTLWVGESCMPKEIPHIIAGGYNLHLSLIGQTIIPHHSACVKCFQLELDRMNQIDTSNIKKLQIKNRKIGSFGPLCSISASMVSMEAIKVLSKRIKPANLNRRGEFNIYSMDIEYTGVSKLDSCPWCGESGIYNSSRGENS